MKDPLYRKILERLNDQGLVGDDFEACMGDVLRDLFPGLVPVPGGKDAGMDGAIADGQGEPFPLVCTTSENVERNLSENLDSFIHRGLSTRKVALATSRKLTPGRRLKLQDLARSKGFILLQIIEQRGVATRLYRNSRWRQDLLNLPGNPSALSVVPSTRRPLIELEPIGRDADRQWLREIRQDRVLVGQPGSGKTFLLHYEMLKGWEALFLVSDDEGAIADALRDQRPRVVVIDDAHVEPRRIDSVRRLRQDVGARFHILAVTWEGAKNIVIEALAGTLESQVRTLELLTRDEIVQVIRQVGVEEHENVLRALVDQSMRKPGLAVTLATLFLQGAWKEVLEGRILGWTLLTPFQELVGKNSTNILATFALGGDAGMTLEDAGDVLGIGLEEIGRKTSALAAGGVLSDLKDGRLAVWPIVLRSALIREVFFPDSGPPSLPYPKLLGRASDYSQAVEAVVTARRYGARISDSVLRDLVSSAESRQAWQGLAASSEDNALWALREYRGDPVDIAEPALENAPEAAIPVLLEHAALENGVPATRRNPIHILTNWIRELNEYRPAEPMRRRKFLARAVRKYLLDGGKTSVGTQAIRSILSPVSESNRSDPGSGRSVRMLYAPLSLDDIRGLEKLWDDLRASISELDQESWRHLSEALWGWIYPEFSFKGADVPEGYRPLMNSFAAKVLQDLLPLAEGSPGLAKKMFDLGRQVGVELEVELDPAYGALFPSDYDGGDLQEWEAGQLKTVRELASEWSRQEPKVVIDRLLFYEQEAQKVQQTWPRWTPAFCKELALSASEPEAWANTLMDRNAAGDLVEPFLKRTIEAQRPSWEALIWRCLNSERYVGFAVAWLLEMKAPPPNLLELALEKAPRFLQLVEILCLRKEVPVPQLMALLTHPDRAVALTAAIGEWSADPKGTVQESLLPVWKKAIADSAQLNALWAGAGYRLKEILAKDPELSLSWLREYFSRSEQPLQLFPEEITEQALSALSRDQRIFLLRDRQISGVIVDFLRQLVGRDIEVYRELLSIPGLSQHRLTAPLGGPPDDSWLPLAMAALDAGLGASAIASATVVTGWGITSGPAELAWKNYDEAMSRFENHENEGIREVAREGRQIAADWIRVWEQRKRDRELYGY